MSTRHNHHAAVCLRLQSKLLKAALCCLGVLTFSGTAAAQHRDLQQPINIEADSAEVDYNRNRSIYRGNVRLTQGSILVKASKVELKRSGANNVSATLTGRPATFNQTLETGTKVNARGQKIVYGAEAAIIELTGDAFIQRGKDTVSANFIRYDIAAGRTVANGGTGRVKITITPPPQN